MPWLNVINLKLSQKHELKFGGLHTFTEIILFLTPISSFRMDQEFSQEELLTWAEEELKNLKDKEDNKEDKKEDKK